MALSVRHPEQFLLCIIELDMGVGVQRHADIAVTHDILQRLRAHSRLCHIGTEGMPAHMGRDLRQLYPVDLIILGYNMLHILFPMQCYHGHGIVLVQPPAVHIFLSAVLVDVTVSIPPVSTLILSIVENAIALVAFFSLIASPFLEGEARPAIKLYHRNGSPYRRII